MKGEDKMKQTIMGIGLIVGVLAGFVPSVDAQTQKKPVDIEACMSWKRVESPDISPTGRWVTYRIAPMEYNPENTDAKTCRDPSTAWCRSPVRIYQKTQMSASESDDNRADVIYDIAGPEEAFSSHTHHYKYPAHLPAYAITVFS